MKLPAGNIYKIIKTDLVNEFAIGGGQGMYTGKLVNQKFELSKEIIFKGKYVTQILKIDKGIFLVSIWNQAGVYLVDKH